MSHFDFTSYALIDGPWRAGSPRGYVSAFFTAFLSRDDESRALLARDAREGASETSLTLEHRPAEAAPITYAELVHTVVTGEADRALESAACGSAIPTILSSASKRSAGSFRDYDALGASSKRPRP